MSPILKLHKLLSFVMAFELKNLNRGSTQAGYKSQ
jgi:hypothetical protein